MSHRHVRKTTPPTCRCVCTQLFGTKHTHSSQRATRHADTRARWLKCPTAGALSFIARGHVTVRGALSTWRTEAVPPPTAVQVCEHVQRQFTPHFSALGRRTVGWQRVSKAKIHTDVLMCAQSAAAVTKYLASFWRQHNQQQPGKLASGCWLLVTLVTLGSVAVCRGRA